MRKAYLNYELCIDIAYNLRNDAELLNHMDRSGSFIKKGSKPVDGKYSDTDADDEQMQLVFRHIDATIRKMGAELLSGNVGIKPLKGIKDGCAVFSVTPDKDGTLRFTAGK